MNSKNDPFILTPKNFSFRCPLKVADMEVVEGGYFCSKCEKKVHDVSAMSKKEYKELQNKHKNLCVYFKRVVKTSVALSLVACSSSTKEGDKEVNPFGGNTTMVEDRKEILKSFKVIDEVFREYELGGQSAFYDETLIEEKETPLDAPLIDDNE